MNLIPFTVYCADIAALSEQTIYNALYLRLPEDRRRKTDALHFEKDRMLSVGAGTLLLRALNDTGLQYMPPDYGEHGKPHFSAYPDFHFNLSHSGSKVLCVVAGQPVGCDVEKVTKVNEALAKRFFAAEEYTALLAQPEGARDEFFFRLWTLKESFIKATGRGLSLPLDAFSVHIGQEEISVAQDIDPAPYAFYEFELDGGYRCACCICDGNCKAPQLLSVDLSAI